MPVGGEDMNAGTINETGERPFFEALEPRVMLSAAPTDIGLSSTSVSENVADGTLVGMLSGTDPDGDALTFSLLDDADGRFAIDGDRLVVADGSRLDHEPGPVTLFSAGFEATEGYSTGALVTGYEGDAGNQQGWYGEFYFYGYMNTNEAVVSTDQAHSGLMSLKIPREDYYYDHYQHAVDEKDTGVMTLQWWQYLEAVTTDKTTSNNLGVGAYNKDGVVSLPEGSYPGGDGGRFQGRTDMGVNVDADTPNTYIVNSGYSGGTIEITEPGIAAQGQWVGYRATMDLDARAFDMFVNTGDGWVQKLDGAEMSYRDYGADNVINSIFFYQLASNNGNYFEGDTAAYVDDIQVTWAAPPPATHQVAVQASDGALTYSETFTITVSDVNEAPTDINLSNTSVDEHPPDGTLVATISGTDPENDLLTFTLTDDAGGRFVIDGDRLVVADGGLLDYEAADPQDEITLLSAGFEATEGYSTGALVTGYEGDAGNQQGWYGEFYFTGYMNTNEAIVSTDQAHSGLMSLKIPREDYYYDFYQHAVDEKDTGVMTLQWWQYLEAVTTDKTTSNNLGVDAYNRDGIPNGDGLYLGGQGGKFRGYTDYGSLVDADTPNSYTLDSGAGGSIAVTSPGIAAQGQWVGYKVAMDLDAGTLDLLVDTGSGWTRKVNDAEMSYSDAGADNVINTILFYQLASHDGAYFEGSTAVYVDDIEVTWSPPPPRSHDVTVQASDGGLTYSETFMISLNNVDEGRMAIDVVLNDGDKQRSSLTRLAVRFGGDMWVSSAAALSLRNDTIGENVGISGAVLQGSGTDTATWNLSGVALDDGYYTAILSAAQVTDASGNHLDGDHDGVGGDDYRFTFFVLKCDANGDARVDSADLAIWHRNYDPLGLNDNTPGTGDWDIDGRVGSSDLGLWQQRYNPLGLMEPGWGGLGGVLPAPPQPLGGTNVALGKEATFWPAPNYQYCTDAGDPTDLTDGVYWQSGGFWTFSGTVGWQFGRQPGALITFDLGAVYPIDAVGFDTVTGAAQVTFPAAVFVYVSDDGQNWHYVTDLINEALPQDSFLRHRFVAQGLETRAHYIAFFVARGGFYAFVDEIEVIKGDHHPGSVSFQDATVDWDDITGDAAGRAESTVQKNTTLYLIEIARDQVTSMGGGAKAAALDQLRRLQRKAVDKVGTESVDYSQGLPYTSVDQEVSEAVGRYFRSLGTEAVTLWQPTGSIWSHTTSPFARPAVAVAPDLHVDMMIGEYEPVAFNLSNNTADPVTITLSLSDLIGAGATPVWSNENVERRITTHVLGSGFQFFDDALPLIKDDTFVIPAGMTRQVWLLPHSGGVEAGDYAATVTITAPTVSFEIPLTATVYPMEMPENPTYLSQAWGYFTWEPAAGYEEQAAAEMERAYTNAHVLYHHYIPWPKVNETTHTLVRDAEGKIVVDFTRFDEMLAYRPYVKQWLFWTGFEFGFMHLKYNKRVDDMPAVGTPEYEAIFKEWVLQIRDHMAAKGFGTDQWAFYWVDEPGEQRFLDYIVPSSAMAKEVDPTILVWEDHQISLDLLEQYPDAIDIHCSPTWYYRNNPAILQHALAEDQPSVHYVCGSSKANDPHSYYRLHHMASVELGLDGAGMWVWGDSGGQFNDYTGSPSYGMVYASTDGPITGKRREAWREGIEDVELWRHLRNAADDTGDTHLLWLANNAPALLAGGTVEYLMDTRLDVLQSLAAVM